MMQGQGYEGQTLMLPAYSAPDLFQLDGKPFEERKNKGFILYGVGGEDFDKLF